MCDQLDDPATDEDSNENGEKEDPAPPNRRNRSRIWAHFDVLDKETRLAQCRLCAASLSYRTTLHNLRKHLERRHALLAPSSRSPPDPLHANKNSDKQGIKAKAMWQYYEIIDKKRGVARCAICLKSLSFRTTTYNLIKHLQRKHLSTVNDEPKFQQEYLVDDTNEAPDSSEPEIPETPKRIAKKCIRRRPPSIEDSDSDDHLPRRPSKAKEKCVIDTFGVYLTTMMKKLPEDVAMRLQLDFVSQLVNAQLVHQPREDSGVVVLHATTSSACEISNSDNVVT